MAAVRVVAGLGYGLATFLFIKNADGVGDYFSDLARTTVHFLSRGPRDRSLGDGNSRDIGAISEKLDRLASVRSETVHVHHGNNRYTSWFTTIIGGTAVVVVIAHVSGLFDFSGIMYVTQSRFKSTTDALKEAVDSVSKVLSVTRRDLLERIGLLDTKMEEANAELKEQITKTHEIVRDDLANVHQEVKDVGSVVGGLETKLGAIDGGLGELRVAMERANHGIQLLCHVVAESYRYGSNQKNEKWYNDLLIYTKVNASQEPSKQLKQNGEGPLMRLISGTNLGASSGADNGGGLSSSFRETLSRQLSGVSLDSS